MKKNEKKTCKEWKKNTEKKTCEKSYNTLPTRFKL